MKAIVSFVHRAKRALVSLLARLADLYFVVFEITRDSADVDIRRFFKKVSRKTHPDCCGTSGHQQTLKDTYSAWGPSQRDAKGRGRRRQPATTTPARDTSGVLLPLRVEPKTKKDFRFESAAVLLTYQKFQARSVRENFVARGREHARRRHHTDAPLVCPPVEEKAPLHSGVTFDIQMPLADARMKHDVQGARGRRAIWPSMFPLGWFEGGKRNKQNSPKSIFFQFPRIRKS